MATNVGPARNLTAQASCFDVRRFGRLDKTDEVFGTYRRKWHAARDRDALDLCACIIIDPRDRKQQLVALFAVASIDASVSGPHRTAVITPRDRLLSLAIALTPLDLLDARARLFLHRGRRRDRCWRSRRNLRRLTGNVYGLWRCRHWDRLR